MSPIAGRVETGLLMRSYSRLDPGAGERAVTRAERNRSLPDLPPISESVPGVVIANWYSMFFPKGTSPAIVGKLSVLIKKALRDNKIDEF